MSVRQIKISQPHTQTHVNISPAPTRTQPHPYTAQCSQFGSHMFSPNSALPRH